MGHASIPEARSQLHECESISYILVKDGKLGHMQLVSSLKLGFEISLLHNSLGTTTTFP